MRGKLPDSGCLIIGDKGKLFSPDDYGATFFLQLEGEEDLHQGDNHEAAKAVPQTIPRSPGHNQEWFDMMKGGTPAYSNFDIAGYLTEIILLGCIALRVGEGVSMEWDGPNMRSPNCPRSRAVREAQQPRRLVVRNHTSGLQRGPLPPGGGPLLFSHPGVSTRQDRRQPGTREPINPGQQHGQQQPRHDRPALGESPGIPPL